ncbi:hypothetical protein C8A01DRAFT_42327, partial [Parachaetomium inaequale]
ILSSNVTLRVRSTFHDNAPTPSLPSGSMYNVAKEVLEEAMCGANTTSGNTALLRAWLRLTRQWG